MVLRFRASRSVRLVLRFPLWLSSKTHSWPPCRHLLHGGPPSSAGRHLIFSLRQTVHAREPLLALVLPSAPSALLPFAFPFALLPPAPPPPFVLADL